MPFVERTCSQKHSLCSYGTVALIIIYFHPEKDEKIDTLCMAQLVVDNCRSWISLMYSVRAFFFLKYLSTLSKVNMLRINKLSVYIQWLEIIGLYER